MTAMKLIYKKDDSDAPVDVLALAAHPDDVELSVGGTLIKLADEGKRIVIADSTQGEMGTRGTVETRAAEAAEAAKILNIQERVNLQLPDGNIGADRAQLQSIVALIRKYRPTILLAPAQRDRHPDHEELHALVRKAAFFAGTRKFDDGQHQEQIAFRPKHILYYMQTYEFEPDFIVDISSVFERKVEAMKAYGTQFFGNSSQKEPQTFISRPEFAEYLQARAKVYGERINVQYGEPFKSHEKLGFSSLSDFEAAAIGAVR